jgi:hypothetical protein
MTVADVFVDFGKASRDGLDQRGTLRVIQRPAPSAPVRFPSVDLDWDSAANQCGLRPETKAQREKLPIIREDKAKRETSGSVRPASSAAILSQQPSQTNDEPEQAEKLSSPAKRRRRGPSPSSQASHTHDEPEQADKPELPTKQRHSRPLVSVEINNDAPSVDTNKDAPSVNKHDIAPIEIDDDIDMPASKKTKEPRARKRKQSLEQAAPVKEPRIQPSPSRRQSKQIPEIPNQVSRPPRTTPTQRPRQRVPSFSGPSRTPADQLSESERRLGLGIMTSPPGRKPVKRSVGGPIPIPNLTPTTH